MSAGRRERSGNGCTDAAIRTGDERVSTGQYR